MKKLWTVIICILIISVVAGCASSAVADTDTVYGYENREGAAKTKVLNIYENEQVLTTELDSKIRIAKNKSELKYKETVNYDEKLSVDIYTDENGNEYKYDSKGMLKGFSAQIELAQDEVSAHSGEVITKDEAVSLAQKYAKIIHGDVTNRYELHRISQPQDGSYTLSLVKKFGDEKFPVTLDREYYCELD